METMTVEQAIEAAKGLTFETVWLALMEDRKQMSESHQRLEKAMAESFESTKKTIDDLSKNTKKTMDDLSKNTGGLGNTLGRLTESMFSAELWKKFTAFGFTFTQQSQHKKYTEGGKLLAEVDIFLENGEYAMLVEIITDLSVGDVDEHLERIELIRNYMDKRDDKRKLVGAIAGGLFLKMC